MTIGRLEGNRKQDADKGVLYEWVYDANYFNGIVATIKLVRQNGFVVMVMMQDETISGAPPRVVVHRVIRKRDFF